jgi:hypothetical protein
MSAVTPGVLMEQRNKRVHVHQQGKWKWLTDSTGCTEDCDLESWSPGAAPLARQLDSLRRDLFSILKVSTVQSNTEEQREFGTELMVSRFYGKQSRYEFNPYIY